MDNPGLRPMPASRTNTVSTVSSQDNVSRSGVNGVNVVETAGELKYGNPRFVGDPLDLNLKGVDLRDVTNLIAANFGINFVYDRSVGPVPVTVTMNGVAWNQGLDQLLKAN